MLIEMHLIVLFVLVFVASVGAEDTIKRCDQIQQEKMPFQDLILFSPFIFYRTTLGIYNCSTIQFVGPAGTDTSYTGTYIIIKGDKTITHDLITTDDSTYSSRQCSDGITFTYRTLFSHMNSPGNASACVFICDSQGINIETLNCVGRTPEDEAYIQYYLDTQLKVPVTGHIHHSSSNCPKPKHCIAYN